jgi:Ca2+-binding RTX toxin-like protein
VNVLNAISIKSVIWSNNIMAFTPNPTPADDKIVSDGASDRIDALAGNDTVIGNGGNDTLIGNFGNDSLLGGIGNDVLDGGFNRDTLDGGAGNDTMLGGDDNDSISGGTGNNLVNGGAGNDILIAANGINTTPGDIGDTLFGGAGIDELRVEGASNYVLTNDLLSIGGLIHRYSAVATNKVEGAIERVRLTGNTADNTIDASAALLIDRTFLFGKEGNDTIKGSQGLDQISGGSGNDSLVGGAGFNFIDGNDGNDILIGGNDDNNLEGGAGNDVVQGGAEGDFFQDSLFDGAGDDRYIGLGGDDFFALDGNSFSSDNISFNLITTASDPNKSLLTGGKFVFGNLDDSATGTDTLEGIETVQISGTAGRNTINAFNFNQNVILIGNGGGDNLQGGRGNDSLRGSFSDNDTISGGLGNDTLIGNGGFNTGEIDNLRGGNIFNGVQSADTFEIGDGYRQAGHAIIQDFSVQDGDKLRLRFPFGGSASDFTFVQKNFNPVSSTNNSSILDTVIFFGSSSNNDIIAVIEDVSITATTPGVEIFG